MRDDLVAQLDALGEDDFYYSPATTKAKINEAKGTLKAQAARIAELEEETQNLRDDLASNERERAHQHGRADRNAAEYAREQAKREALRQEIAAKDARIAELEAALANARRDGMEAAAKWHDEQAAKAQRLSDMKVSAEDEEVWGDYAENHREYAAEIRAALAGGKDV